MSKPSRRSLNEFQTPLGVIKEEFGSKRFDGVKGVLQITDPQAALSVVRKSRTHASDLNAPVAEDSPSLAPRPPYCVECKQYLREFSDPAAPSLTGYLHKKRSVQRRLSFRMWKQRYFRLVGGHLAYYEDQEASVYSLPNGVMHLEGCFVSCPGLSNGLRGSEPYALELRVARRSLSSDSTWSLGSGSESPSPQQQQQQAVYLLKAQTEQDLQLWVEALSKLSVSPVPARVGSDSASADEKFQESAPQPAPRLPSSSSSFSLAARSRRCEQCAAETGSSSVVDLDAFTLADQDGFLLWLQKDIDPAMSVESDWVRVWAVCARRHLALFANPEDVPHYKPISVLHLRSGGAETTPPTVEAVPLELTAQHLSEIRRRSKGASSLSRLNLHMQVQMSMSREKLPGWAFAITPAPPTLGSGRTSMSDSKQSDRLVFRTESAEDLEGQQWINAVLL